MRKGTLFLWLVVVVASLAIVSGCANSKADPKKVGVSEANVQAEFLAMKAAGEKERGGYELMSLKELKTKLDAKEDMLVVDTRMFTPKSGHRVKLRSPIFRTDQGRFLPEQNEFFFGCRTSLCT